MLRHIKNRPIERNRKNNELKNIVKNLLKVFFKQLRKNYVITLVELGNKINKQRLILQKKNDESKYTWSIKHKRCSTKTQ